ncbi:MAG TPA: alpha/beta hydrolase [Sphingomicrobium sp.]|nr:alpha/beta hydrolase [Sphingomicrobium sp.]
MTAPEVGHLDVDGRRIGYRRRDGSSPTLVFLPGYASNMEGAKALALDAFAERRGLAMVRFDYSGTGSSGRRFEDGTLELWLDEALAIVDRLTDGPVVVIGSSMGGWLALHLALLRSERVKALVGIAAAPDFTEWGAERNRDYLTSAFRESGGKLSLLDKEIAIDCPIRLIHGEADDDVPLDIAFRTMRALRSADVQVTVIKGGGHRLSEPHEIDAILSTVAGLLEQIA